ncbi:CmcJ/NvfI family oxidoreductase [Actinokineospora globicatena]|uniref:Methyltransferase n=1 Tax=Actinokineospora globicatena TaxID=103729 RepID=A0A9W6V938_9PSEU|nr:CmcJ/NvfI family oxidoreductase [Actinokineospora globicatena]GLW90573.1 hypothetical protein Aglo03_13890 [Actinokineospora globicatena]
MTEYVEARVRYLAPVWRDTDEIPTIADWSTMAANTVEHTVRVHDAWDADCDVETTGFQRVSHTTLADFTAPQSVERVYLPEVASLVQKLTSADHVVATHHYIRWGNPGDFEAGYAGFLHGDKPLADPMAYSLARARHLQLGPARSHDFAWYNTWQPIDHPATRNPLALIDARTVSPGDLHPYRYDGAGEQNLETVPLHSSAHRFHYFPSLPPEDLILFKQLDTRPHHTPTCLHSAFETPAPPATPLRRSIETRWLCAFTS